MLARDTLITFNQHCTWSSNSTIEPGQFTAFITVGSVSLKMST